LNVQGHYNINFPTPSMVEEAICKLATLGLDIQITEMDISMYGYENRCKDMQTPTNNMLERQAECYDEMFNVFRKHSDVISGVTMWGVADDYTWLDDFPVEGRKDWPLLYDEKLCKKPAYNRIIHY